MSSQRNTATRARLRRELDTLARRMVFGSLGERVHTCGQPTCRCHHGGPKHGPHLQITYRGDARKTVTLHVPQALGEPVREGVAAWQRFLAVARELADRNRAQLWAAHVRARGR
jgi:hypothetical protein